MSNANPLAGLIGNYGDSDEETEEAAQYAARVVPDASASMLAPVVPMVPAEPAAAIVTAQQAPATIHPAPITHCAWSACYDETSGFTYYWNQQTNAVTWETPPEYLMALKLAQQHLYASGSTEVSAAEWQLYQQALAEKQYYQSQVVSQVPVAKPEKKPVAEDMKYAKPNPKRAISEDDDDKIELITSYYHSDSESNDEADSAAKPPTPGTKPTAAVKPPLPKNPNKKQKTKPTAEYGPSLPPNQNYTIPIGPELPPIQTSDGPKTPEVKEPVAVAAKEEEKKPAKPNEEDSQDENQLLIQLKDKAKILEKLGGEIPTELQKIIRDETRSLPSSPNVTDENSKDSKTMETNIDDLLDEIEKKELPKIAKSKVKIDIFGDDENFKSSENSGKTSPRSGDRTPPLKEEFKALFPSSKAITEESETPVGLFPSAVNIQENGVETKQTETAVVQEKKANVYLTETVAPSRKKLRISNSVLPVKTSDVPSYTTKYSQHIEGFSGERTGLGFSEKDDEETGPKNAISYGNGLLFTKGETLNEDKKDEALDDLTDLVEAKLKFLNQLQPYTVTPVQEMLIQMQTLACAFRAGGLTGAYWRRWSAAAAAALRQHETCAAPPGWTCAFQRSEGRYRYVRASDGLAQWEYPAVQQTDMEICTTPPPAPPPEYKEDAPPPLPPSPPPPPPPVPPAPPVAPAPPAPPVAPPAPAPPAAAPPPPPPPACWARVATPPPPVWADPPPPGCDDLPPLPPEPPKQEIGDELLSFYNDIAELEKQSQDLTPAHTPSPPPPPLSPQTPPPPPPPPADTRERDRDRAKEKEAKSSKKKTKVKISSSIGMKHKSVSSLVAKWQQVADQMD